MGKHQIFQLIFYVTQIILLFNPDAGGVLEFILTLVDQV